MKNSYILTATFFIIALVGFSQDKSTFDKNYQSIDQEFKSWDPVRGAWLSNSIVALANDQPVPDRTFPENYTPYQMLTQVPDDVRLKVASMTRNNVNSGQDSDLWTSVDNIVAVRDCAPVSGRSYGDPHMVTFDGARYSFQTVGEFIYARSGNGKVEVQTRQKPQQEDFSLNTAVAMNVNGDRVCIYASDYPDSDFSTPIRVNGEPVTLQDRTYFLNNGGTIRFGNNMYVVDWPTGESLSTRMSTSQGMRFMNVHMNIYPCSNGGYSGLMGNANNIAGDDYNNRSSIAPTRIFADRAGSADAERARQQWISKEFAEGYRITQAESLFDYGLGQSTHTFTDRSFPRFYRSIHDLDDMQRDAARRRCISAGVDQSDLNGCIYDNGFLNMEPSRPHIIDDPTEGTVLRPLDGEVPNVNPRPQVDKNSEIDKPNIGAQPIDKIIEEKKESEIKELDEPDIEPVERPEVNEPKTQPRTDPWGGNKTSEPSREPKISFPKTTTSPTPRPTPRPTPKPTPRPSTPRSGGIKPGRGL